MKTETTLRIMMVQQSLFCEGGLVTLRLLPYGAVEEKDVALARLREATFAGVWDHEMRPMRNVLAHAPEVEGFRIGRARTFRNRVYPGCSFAIS